MSETPQQFVASLYRVQLIGQTPTVAAWEVVNNLARTIASDALAGRTPSRYLLDCYRHARVWLSHVMARDTQPVGRAS